MLVFIVGIDRDPVLADPSDILIYTPFSQYYLLLLNWAELLCSPGFLYTGYYVMFDVLA